LLDIGVIESQPGISAGMATASPVIAASIGHCPVAPLAASPLKGSITQSNRIRIVRRNLMGWIITETFYLAFTGLFDYNNEPTY
jgi:hypothetical protein